MWLTTLISHKVFLHYVFVSVLLEWFSLKLTSHTHYIHKAFLHYVFVSVIRLFLTENDFHTHYIHKDFLHYVFMSVLLDSSSHIRCRAIFWAKILGKSCVLYAVKYSNTK